MSEVELKLELQRGISLKCHEVFMKFGEEYVDFLKQKVNATVAEGEGERGYQTIFC